MSQQQTFVDAGSMPGVPGIETVTGNDGLPVTGSGSPVNIDIVGNTVQGLTFTRTAADEITGTIADATSSQKGVVTLPTQEEALNYTSVNAAMSPYVVTATDYFISVDSTAGAVIIQLPNSTTAKREFVIKDRLGQSTTNNITVTTVGGVVTMDGNTSYVFTDNYESLEILFNGTTYEVF